MNRYQELLAECRIEEEEQTTIDLDTPEVGQQEPSEEEIEKYVQGLVAELRHVLDTLDFELSEADATAEEVLEAVDEFLVESEDLPKEDYEVLEDYWSELKSISRFMESAVLQEATVKVKAGKTAKDLEDVLKSLKSPPRPPPRSPMGALASKKLPRDEFGRVKVRVPEGAKRTAGVPQLPSARKDSQVVKAEPKKKEGWPSGKHIIARAVRSELARKSRIGKKTLALSSAKATAKKMRKALNP